MIEIYNSNEFCVLEMCLVLGAEASVLFVLPPFDSCCTLETAIIIILLCRYFYTIQNPTECDPSFGFSGLSEVQGLWGQTVWV